MKKTILPVLISMLVGYAGAQNFQWAVKGGLYQYDYGYGVATDNSGNVYVAGKYEQNANFSGTILPNQGNHDIYVAQYSSSGNLNWIKTGGGPLGDYAHCLTSDGTSNVFIAGEIEGYNNLISFPGSTVTLTAVGDNDVFVARYDLSGNLQWARSAGWNYSEKAQGVACDASGNVYIAGFFTDTTKFYGPIIPGAGGRDIFLAKYDVNGVFQWMQKAGGPGRDEAIGLKCDAAGNVYMCGMYSNGAMFGTQTYTTVGNYLDAYLAKYSPSGTLQWVKTGGGNYDDVAWSVTVDGSGKIYTTGEFNAYATFGTFAFATAGNADVFVTCYDNAGNIQWAKRAGGALNDRARGIGTNGTSLYLTGQFGATANFGSYSVAAADSSDIFMAALDNTGSFLWASSVGGGADSTETLGYESGIAICAEANGNVYAAGAMLNGGVFGGTTLSPYSRTDMFLTKLNGLAGIKENAGDKGSISIYPNPGSGSFSIGITDPTDQKLELSVYNSLGQLIEKRVEKARAKINLDLTSHETGIYIIEIKPENGEVIREKLIVQK